MPKPLDPNGLAGAFAKGPPTSLDFLVPAKKPNRNAEPKAEPTPKAIVGTAAPVSARTIWTPGAPPPEPDSWRGRIARRIERVVGRVLCAVLP